jgi:hypothetical protein
LLTGRIVATTAPFFSIKKLGGELMMFCLGSGILPSHVKGDKEEFVIEWDQTTAA